MEFIQNYMLYILFGIGMALLILLVLCIVLFVKLNKQKKKYDFFMGANRRPSHNLEMKLEKYYRTSKEIEEKYGKLLDMVTDMDKTMKSNVQKVGLVRYNPFEEMGGNLCFALALLDGEDNGVVLNGIHSRTGSFTYAKPIQMGVSIYMLSEEEIKAVEMAKDRAYHPEHEKVVKVKFRPTFRKKDKEPIMEKQIPLAIDEEESAKETLDQIGDVTKAEKAQIMEDELRANQIAAIDQTEEYDEMEFAVTEDFAEIEPVFIQSEAEKKEKED